MNEESFTAWLAQLFSRRPDVVTGIGDDAAALDLKRTDGMLQLAAADQLVESVHYLPGTDPALAASKLLKRNISDIAAMGGVPTHALLTLALHPMDEEWLSRFHQGLEETAKRFNLSVIGGDITSLPQPGKAASLTILGLVEAQKLSLRSNARAGDFLYASGEFGNSFATGHHLNFEPRLAEGRYLSGTLTCCMMDVSDGLLKDAFRIADASHLSLELFPERIPLRQGASLEGALSDGEDYELLFAVAPENAAFLEEDWPFPETRLTRIGCFHERRADDPDGTPRSGCELYANINKGYDYFNEK